MTTEQPTSGAQAAPSVARYYVTLFQANSGALSSLSHSIVYALQEKLDEVVTTAPEETEIDLWLHSLGGDAHAAYKLALELRHRCKRLRAIVPDMAKSAATLLTLCADCIYMGPSAELGPLDVQMEHPLREGEIVSGLDLANSLEFLSVTAMNQIVSGGAAIFASTDLPRVEVLREVCNFTAQFLQPAVAKLDIALVHRASKMLQVAEEYAKLLLGMRQPDGANEILSAQRSADLIETLVSEYPAHEFVIGREDARELGFPVVDVETYPHRNLVKALVRQVRASGRTSMGVYSENRIGEIAQKHLKTVPQPRHVEQSKEAPDGTRGQGIEELARTGTAPGNGTATATAGQASSGDHEGSRPPALGKQP